MGKPIKIRAKVKDGVADVKALMPHDMESGFRLDPETAETIPAHYITDVDVALNGEHVMTAYWGPAVSRNPYVAFKINGAASGDTLMIRWRDNMDDSSETEIALK